MKGRSGTPALSTGTSVSPWVARPTAATVQPGAAAKARAMPLCTASRYRLASASAHMPQVCSAYSCTVQASSARSGVNKHTFTDVVPASSAAMQYFSPAMAQAFPSLPNTRMWCMVSRLTASATKGISSNAPAVPVQLSWAARAAARLLWVKILIFEMPPATQARN